MNRYNFKNRLVLLLFGFSLFYIQAADKDAIENQPSVKNKQEAGNKNEHIADPSHQLYTQPSDGLRFTTKNTQRTSQKNNTHVTTGAVSTKKSTSSTMEFVKPQATCLFCPMTGTGIPAMHTPDTSNRPPFKCISNHLGG